MCLCLSQLSPVLGSRPSCQSMSPGDCWRVLSMSSGPRCCSAAVRAMRWRAAGCCSARPMGHGALEKSSRSVEVSHREPWHGHLQDGRATFLYSQLRGCEHVGPSSQRCPWHHCLSLGDLPCLPTTHNHYKRDYHSHKAR